MIKKSLKFMRSKSHSWAPLRVPSCLERNNLVVFSNFAQYEVGPELAYFGALGEKTKRSICHFLPLRQYFFSELGK
jgi:hypothetical protein